MSGIELVRPSAWVVLEVERRQCSPVEALLIYFDKMWEESMRAAEHLAAIESQPSIHVNPGSRLDAQGMLDDVRKLLNDPTTDWPQALRRLSVIVAWYHGPLNAEKP